MVAHDEFFQEKQPAAVLKHSVLAAYGTTFCSMLGFKTSGPVWIIDGYAGPGSYEVNDHQGAKGSPVVALEIAESAQSWKSPVDVRCVFIEPKQKYFKKLQENIGSFQERGLRPLLFQGEVSEHLPEAWEHVGTNPALTLLDPFGVSMERNLLVDTLLNSSYKHSEVMLNINLVAISRHGGYLEAGPNGTSRVKAGLPPQGVEKTDRFLGGNWWRDTFLEERFRTGSASEASASVVMEYLKQVREETETYSLFVPIRRRPDHPPLFLLTLFYRHAAAGYKFADSAAKATQKWRDAYRRQDLEDFLDDGSGQEMFSLVADSIMESRERDAKKAEDDLMTRCVTIIKENIRDSLQELPALPVGQQVVRIFGTTLSLAGEPALRKAWNELEAEDLVLPRDKKRSMWKQTILKRP